MEPEVEQLQQELRDINDQLIKFHDQYLMQRKTGKGIHLLRGIIDQPMIHCQCGNSFYTEAAAAGCLRCYYTELPLR